MGSGWALGEAGRLELESHLRNMPRAGSVRAGSSHPSPWTICSGSGDSVFSLVERKSESSKEGRGGNPADYRNTPIVKSGTQGSERKSCMTQLIKIARGGPTSLQEQFRCARVLLEILKTRTAVHGPSLRGTTGDAQTGLSAKRIP